MTNSRRAFLGQATAVLGASVGKQDLHGGPRSALPHRRNILLFCVDAMRAEFMGCAGTPLIQTPNLDRLAERGIQFTRAYCANPICTPARTSMFTGLSSRDHGAWSNGVEAREGLPWLPKLLSDAGYRTHGIGKLHLSRWRPSPALLASPRRFPESSRAWEKNLLDEFPVPYFGFQSVDFAGGHGSWVYGHYFQWLEKQTKDARRLLRPAGAREKPTGAPSCYKMGLPEELHYNRWIANRAIARIEEADRSGHHFFMWCSFPDPHVPFCCPAPYCDMYSPRDMPLPNRRKGELDDLPPHYKAIFEGQMTTFGVTVRLLRDAFYQEMVALSYGMMSHVDHEIGRVLARLDELGLRENTIVAFVGDHGSDLLGDHWMTSFGSYMFEPCVRIPWIVSAPGCEQGKASENLVSQLDLVPTLLDLCGIEQTPPKALEANARGKLGQAARLQRWPGRSLKPVLEGKSGKPREAVIIQNDDPYLGLKMRTVVTDRFKLTFYAGQDYGELFDLQNDPGELRNLWNQPGWRKTRDELTVILVDEEVAVSPWHPLPHSDA